MPGVDGKTVIERWLCQSEGGFSFSRVLNSSEADLKSRDPSYSARPVIAPTIPEPDTARSARTSSRFDMPPDAMTGRQTSSAKAAVDSMLGPLHIPSREISV